MTLSAAIFYLLGIVILTATGLAVTRRQPIHAVLYLIVAFLSTAALFFLLGAPLLGVFMVIVNAGAIMVLVLGLTNASDVFATAIVGVYGALALVAILADETDNGFANIYSTSVSIQNVRPKATLRRLVPIVTTAGLIVAALLSAVPRASVLVYQPFLYFIGGVFVPMLGVVLADVYVVRRTGYGLAEFGSGSTRPALPAFMAWILGMATYFPIYLVNSGYLSVDLGGLNLVGASVPSFVLSAIVYVAATRFLAPADKRAAA